MPKKKIELVRCLSCDLLFKSVLPAASLLAEVFVRQAGAVWTDDYDYADEVKAIRGLVGNRPLDVLDVGASSGGLLMALGYVDGRRSALDVVAHPGVIGRIRGEFIRGLADSADLSWSGKPYDVVTMFDLLEHLYDPERAFANLWHLVKPGGFVVVETGDADSSWPRRFGVNRWWYACLVEHHIFWSRRPLEGIAAKHGFRVLSLERKRHKEQRSMRVRGDLMRVMKTVIYRLTPGGYSKLMKTLGKSGLQPWSPFARDHFRAVLQKAPK